MNTSTKYYSNKDRMLTLRIPKELLKHLNTMSRQKSMSRSNLVRFILESAIDTSKHR